MRYAFVTMTLLGLCLITMDACVSDRSGTSSGLTVTVRLSSEPDNLNPTRSRSSSATQIESLIMPPLAEYDPFTLELTPLLVERRAEIEDIPEGPYAGGQRFRYRMRQEAEWEDGTPVTGHDYAFTVKAVLDPEVNAAALRGYLSFIREVEVDEADPRSFNVVVSEPYMLAEVVTCNFNILPRHIYDREGLLEAISFSDLSQPIEQLPPAKMDALVRFAEHFSSPGFNRDTVTGAGAYRLTEWVTGDYLILDRKDDWWGDRVMESPTLLRAYPKRIVYRVIPDETAAISALKDGSVDVVSQVSAANFTSMRSDGQWAEKFTYATPSLMQYRGIELNTRDPLLSDNRVRRALAHAVDYDAIISAVEMGIAERTVGPFHPGKPYYNKSLTPIEFDIDKARSLLKDAGWSDTDGDGTVDKVINGVREELELNILVTQRPAGQQVAVVVKESAARAGIAINIETRDNNAFRQAIGQREFQLLPVQVRSSPAPNDPYPAWHSESDRPDGSNRTGFRNSMADSLIQVIRTAPDETGRNQAYLALQRVIYDEQPVIFLYVPLERLIVDAAISMQPSSRRPGYFENLFQ